jgi:hypothetical protein
MLCPESLKCINANELKEIQIQKEGSQNQYVYTCWKWDIMPSSQVPKVKITNVYELKGHSCK